MQGGEEAAPSQLPLPCCPFPASPSLLPSMGGGRGPRVSDGSIHVGAGAVSVESCVGNSAPFVWNRKVWNHIYLQLQIRGLPRWLLDSFTVGVWERPPGCFGHRLVAIAHGGAAAAAGGRRRGVLGLGGCFSSEAVPETAGDGEEEAVSGNSFEVGGSSVGGGSCGQVSEGAGGARDGGAGVSGPHSEGAEQDRWPDPQR